MTQSRRIREPLSQPPPDDLRINPNPTLSVSGWPSGVGVSLHVETIQPKKLIRTDHPSKKGKGRATFVYSAKFICGSLYPAVLSEPGQPGPAIYFQAGAVYDHGQVQRIASLAPGTYMTAVNIYNPNDREANLRKRAIIARPEGKERSAWRNPVSEPLPAGHAAEVEWGNITQELLGLTSFDPVLHFVTGFVEIESDVELDVVAVYTVKNTVPEKATWPPEADPSLVVVHPKEPRIGPETGDDEIPPPGGMSAGGPGPQQDIPPQMAPPPPGGRRDDGKGGRHRGDDGGWDCHCQGSRLLILMGPMQFQTESGHTKKDEGGTGLPLAQDEAMYIAQKWALDFYQQQRAANAHIHMLRYDTDGPGAPNNTGLPKLPVNQPAPAEDVAVKPGKAVTFPRTPHSWQPPAETIRSLDHTLPDCCCFFTEVMLICHGHQGANFSFVTDTLAKILGGRPVEKFVFWSCRSSRLFSPSEPTHFYQKLAWVFQPKRCPCGCDCPNCKAFDPDCKSRHCPDGTKPTTIITSGAMNGVPVPLGLNPASTTNPFTSPDGRVRVITIQPAGAGPADHQITADMSPANQQIDVFGGAKTDTDTNLTPAGADTANSQREQEYRRKTLKDSPVERPMNPYTGYSGPTLNPCDCDPEDGCMLGATCSGPDY